MASPFTSTQAGLWDASDVDTWGQGIGVYPQTAGDVVNISHLVTYNKSSATQMGAITINSGGTLKAHRSLTTVLTLGNVDIQVNSGGTLDLGRTGDVVAAANTCTVEFATTSDNSKGINVASVGSLYTLDNADFYGGLKNSTLQANWTTGTSFYVVDDVTGKWAAGMFLTVHKNPAVYSNYNTDIALVSISSVSWDGVKSTITINEAFPTGTFYAGGRVELVSRNVLLQKLSASTVVGNYNSNRPRLRMVNSSASVNCEVGGLWTGWYQLSIDSSAPVTAVIRNGSYGFNFGSSHNVSGSVYSCSNGFNFGSSHNVSGAVYSCSNGFNGGSSHNVSGAVYSCNYGFNGGSSHNVSGAVYSCNYGFNGGAGIVITGSVDFDLAENLAPNTSAFAFNAGLATLIGIVVRGAKISTPLTFANRNNVLYSGWMGCEHYDQVYGAHRVFHAFADLIKDDSVVRSGGGISSQNIVALSNCSLANPVQCFEWTESGVPAAAQVREFWIRGDLWSVFPTNAEFYVEAEYPDAGLATATVSSSEVLTANQVWTKLTVTFTPAQTGNAKYRLWVKVYGGVGGASLWADTVLSRPGYRPQKAQWRDGQPQLDFDYSTWACVGPRVGSQMIRGV